MSNMDDIISKLDQGDVRRRFIEEGRSARNLLVWSVPLLNNCNVVPVKYAKQDSLHSSLALKYSTMVEGVRRTSKRCITDEKRRPRSVSEGRNYNLDYKARYWAFLFENLRRAVDEIHETCETDESIAECKEAIMVLDNYTKDFHCLIEWIHLKRNFDSTPPRSRPTSLAWEMRRPSTRSNLLATAFRNISNPGAVRKLKFDDKADVASGSENGLSIMDCSAVGSVRNVSLSPRSNPEADISEEPEILGQCSEDRTMPSSRYPLKWPSTSGDINESVVDAESTSAVMVTETVTTQSEIESKLTSSKVETPFDALRLPDASGISCPKFLKSNCVTHVPRPEISTATQCSHSQVTVNFNCDTTRSESTAALNSTNGNKRSWADRVQGEGIAPSSTVPSNHYSSEEKTRSMSEEDGDGWKMVQRVRSKCRISPPKKIDTSSKENVFCDMSGASVGSKNSAKSVERFKSARSYEEQPRKTSPAKETKTKKNAASILYESKVLRTSAGSLPSLHLLKNGESTSESESRSKQKCIPKASKKSTRRSQSPNAGSTIVKGSSRSSVGRECRNLPRQTSSCEQPATGGMPDIAADDISGESLNNVTRTGACEAVVKLFHNRSGDRDQASLPVCRDRIASEVVISAKAICPDHDLPFSRGMLWGEYMDCLDAEPRPPGRVIEIHEKLSSPSRKRSLTDSIRRHEEKQAKAQEQRERYLEEKAQRGKEISKKVEEKRLWKEEVTQQKRVQMERKLQRAEEKRRAQLLMIVRKAHDEEEKVNEIAFINTLEAQNKRHDVLSRLQGHEARLQDIQEERQRKQEEKAAKEAAAEERRRALEAERQAKLMEMQEKRKLKEHKIEQHLQEKEKERQELAREKARDREERLSALQAAQQATMEELQKKIQQKQVDSARRHEMNIEHIRHRALELSILRLSSCAADDAPQLVPYDTKKFCSLCNVVIATEVYLLSHLRGKNHQQAIREKNPGVEPTCEEIESYNLKHIVDAPADQLDPLIAIDKERQKTMKRRCKRLKNKMTSRSNDHSLSANLNTLESQNKMKIKRCMKDMTRCIKNCGSGPWPTNAVANLDRSLGDLSRIIDGKARNASQLVKDQLVFYALDGFQVLAQILGVITRANPDLPTVVPSRTLVNACNVYRLMSSHNRDICLFLLQSNNLMMLMDLLIHRLKLVTPDDRDNVFIGSYGNMITSLPIDPVANALMQLLSAVYSVLVDECNKINGSLQEPLTKSGKQGNQNSTLAWIHDIISYTVSVGVVDSLFKYFSIIRGQIDGDVSLCDFIQQATSLLVSLTKLLSCNFDVKDNETMFRSDRMEDDTQLVATLQITELVGTISLLYGMLLHSGAPSRCDSPPPQLPAATLTVTISTLHMLNNFAFLDLQMFQTVVGAEGTSLEFRHIVSYLLWYCSHWQNTDMLHELILIVGYFTVLNADNQVVIQSGLMPTVLQQLCILPFQYFSDPPLVDILFPSIIACCFNNRLNAAILEQELSCDLLAHFIEEKKLGDSTVVAVKTESGKCEDVHKWALEKRFPRSLWDEAHAFFHASSE